MIRRLWDRLRGRRVIHLEPQALLIATSTAGEVILVFEMPKQKLVIAISKGTALRIANSLVDAAGAAEADELVQ